MCYNREFNLTKAQELWHRNCGTGFGGRVSPGPFPRTFEAEPREPGEGLPLINVQTTNVYCRGCGMHGIGLMVRVVGMGSSGHEFKSCLAVELI